VRFFNSRFYNNFIRRRFFLLSFVCIILGFNISFGSSEPITQKRKVGRVQAVYLTHLIDFTNWDSKHLPKSSKPAKVVFVGDDENGVFDSFNYLVNENKVRIEGRSVEVINVKELSQNALSEMPQIVFFLANAKIDAQLIQKLKSKSLIIGLEPDLVKKGFADIAFVVSKNRVRLVIDRGTFKRRSPGLSSRMSTLRNVVEIIPEK
tara:strand:+ start:2375 stop:2992 length:618 start_codon:yes stop_codon:yes gene_type:complete